MKLYVNYNTNLFGQLALVCADLAHVNVEVVVVSKEEQESKDFKAKKMVAFPILETDEGLIFESAAIAAYFARCAPNSGLLGQSQFQ